MAFTAGVANVLVVPSFKGFQSAVGRQVNSTMPAAGRTAGAAMGGGIAAGLRGTSGAVTAAAGTAAAGAAGAATAAGTAGATGFVSRAAGGIRAGGAAITGAVRTAFVGGAAAGATAGAATGAGFMGGLMRTIAPLAAILGPAAVLSGGYSRLANIEDAQAKLRGLGHSAETVDEVMQNALDAVTGTAFGLDEAATVAAGMLAAGIEPGEELTRILSLTADSATIAGTSLGEMGAIWNKVGAGGRIQGEEINQLGDRGIPILQLLADEMDTTVEGVRDLSREGAIGFAEFASAMESGMAGAAQESGATTRGTLRNVGAAVSRLGATILEEIFPKIRDWGNLAIGTIDEKVIPAWDRAVSWVRDNSEWLTPVTTGLTTMIAALAAFKIGAGIVAAITAIVGLATPIGWIVLAVVGVAGALASLWKNNEGFRDWILGVWEGIKGAAQSVAEWFTGTLVPWLQGVWESVKAGFAAVGDGVAWVWENVIKPAWDAVAGAASWLWETVLSPVFGFIGDVWDRTGGWILDVVQNVVLLAWDLMVYAIRTLWENYLSPIFSNLGAAWEVVGLGIELVWLNLIKPVWDAIKTAATFLWEHALAPVFERIRAGWETAALGIELIWLNILKPVWDVIAGFVEDTIVPGIERGLALADNAWRGIANMMREPINWVINFVWNDGLKAAFDNVARAIGSDATLPAAPTIPQFAKGGRAQPGWALVGEEGPELVNFTSPGRVYTASETQRMLGAGGAGMFSESNPPHGAGFWDDVGAGWSSTWRGAKDAVVAGVGSAVDWARGGLANAADFLLRPLFDGLGGLMSHWGPTGQVGADTMGNVKDQLVGWIRGKDDEARVLSGPVGKGNARGAQPHVALASQAFANAVGGIQTMQAFNQSMAGGHPHGLAVDYIDRIDKLNRLADTIVQSGGGDRFNYMAWNRRIWRPGRGWAPQTRGFGNDPFHTWHVHAQWHDQGGMLQPGVSMLANGTGKPEPVLTSAQWQDISVLAAKGATGPSHMTIVDANGELIGRMRVEADGRIVARERQTGAFA